MSVARNVALRVTNKAAIGGGGSPALPENALTLGGEPLTLGGEILTLDT